MSDEIVASADRHFFREMDTADALTLVVRGLIHIEHELIALLEEAFVQPKDAAIDQMEYSMKVSVAVGLGLRPSIGKALRALGTIRNKMAHQLEFQIDASAADNLYKALDAQAKDLVNRIFDGIQARESRKLRFATLPPLDKVRILFVTYRQAVRAARSQAIGHRAEIANVMGVGQ